ncbi:hypothetical protein [uncultured Succiniclasticum sp.]|uniref:hypothetical protein n=1 Tax=uncultured Succiniclasticum sp. TaxID=1500547 RepID=UPI0025F9EED1|nr:hypothetical protein [uncultured Succiniclasticum sp.]
MIHTYSYGGKSHINVYSDMNDWMDVTFTVDDKDRADAVQTLRKAYDDWFEPVPEAECECYGDWLEAAMKEAGIEYEVSYADSDSDEEE